METLDYSKSINLTGAHQVFDPKGLVIENEKIDTILIPEHGLEKRVKFLAREICNDYKDCKDLLVIAILKGAFVFAADLIREMYRYSGMDIKIDFIKTSTYGRKIKKTGEIQKEVTFELALGNVENKNVLIVEDIVDQCFTMTEIINYLNGKNAASVKICILLSKRLQTCSDQVARLKRGLICDYVGFEVPDVWVAGYGIDAGEDFRQLPFVVTVKEAFYK